MGIEIDGRDFMFLSDAFDFCENEYGYEGPAWEALKLEESFEELEEFLLEDGQDAEVFSLG